jgi:hypothetical protein
MDSRSIIERVVAGDIKAFAILAAQSETSLRKHADQLPDLILSVPAVLAVLDAWERGDVSPQQVQAWASFVRRGYISGSGPGPVTPIPIDYDVHDEDRIAEAIARLDEIGDLIDGNPSPGEVRSLLLNV